MAPAYQVIKKLKIDHLWLDLRAVSHSMLQWLQNVIKKQRGHTDTELLNTSSQQSSNYHLEISCNNKVLIKTYSTCNKRNELLGHPLLLKVRSWAMKKS